MELWDLYNENRELAVRNVQPKDAATKKGIVIEKRSAFMAWELFDSIEYYKKQGASSDQTALVSFLKEVQEEYGGSIPGYILPEAAEGLGVKESYLLAVIRRLPSLRLSDSHCLELCAGPNCGKHTALADFAEKVCRKTQGKLTVKYVPCMRLCGKGPNIKLDGRLYNRADEALLCRLMEEL